MTDVKVEQCDINEAEEFRDVLDSADAEYPSYVIPMLATILARHRQAAEKATRERDAGIAVGMKVEFADADNAGNDEAEEAWHGGMAHAADRIATAIMSQNDG